MSQPPSAGGSATPGAFARPPQHTPAAPAPSGQTANASGSSQNLNQIVWIFPNKLGDPGHPEFSLFDLHSLHAFAARALHEESTTFHTMPHCLLFMFLVFAAWEIVCIPVEKEHDRLSRRNKMENMLSYFRSKNLFHTSRPSIFQCFYDNIQNRPRP